MGLALGRFAQEVLAVLSGSAAVSMTTSASRRRRFAPVQKLLSDGAEMR